MLFSQLLFAKIMYLGYTNWGNLQKKWISYPYILIRCGNTNTLTKHWIILKENYYSVAGKYPGESGDNYGSRLGNQLQRKGNQSRKRKRRISENLLRNVDGLGKKRKYPHFFL